MDSDTVLIDDPDLNEISDLFGVLTMFESSFSHVSHYDFALQIESKVSMHRETGCLTEREKEKRKFCDQCCQVDVRVKSTEPY